MIGENIVTFKRQFLRMIRTVRLCQFPEGDRPERLAERVAAFANRASVAGKLEEHSPVFVEGVFLDKVQRLPALIQPDGVLRFAVVVQMPHHPGETPLLPDALVGVEQLAFPVDAGHNPALLVIDSVVEPKWNGVVKQRIGIKLIQFVDVVFCVGHG